MDDNTFYSLYMPYDDADELPDFLVYQEFMLFGHILDDGSMSTMGDQQGVKASTYMDGCLMARGHAESWERWEGA